jgi:hypothetical protein
MAATTTSPEPPERPRRRRKRSSFAIEVPTGVGRLSTAAATRLRDVGAKQFERQEWQEEAYGHVNAIGELGYVVALLADTVARGDMVILERDLETGDVIVPSKNDDGEDIIEGDRQIAEKGLLAFRGPSGDWRTITRMAAEADVIAGEGHLIGVPLDGQQIAWEFLSIMEIETDRTGEKTVRKRHAKRRQSVEQEVLPPATYTSRYHRRDPQHSGDATSALRRVAASCREVVLLTQLVEATIKSHIPAGILLVADELSLPVGPEDELSGDPEVDPLLEILTQHLSRPIEDRRSAAALVPLLLNAPAELLDKALKLVQLDPQRMDPAAAIDLRENSLGRIATGLDVPPEIMQGLGGLNHWTGATVSKDFIEKHVIPIGERLAQFFTIAYLRRVLMDAEGWDEARAERFEVAYDPAVLLSRADAAASADSLWRDRVISDDARIRAHGFDPDEDRPKEEERFRRYVEAIALSPSVTNKAFLAALGLGVDQLVEMGMDPEAAEAMLSPPSTSGPGPDDGEGPDEDPPEAGEPGANEDVQQAESVDPGGVEQPVTTVPEDTGALVAQIRTMASATLVRALERAANQAIGKLPKESIATRDRVRALPKLEVLAAIPQTDWRQMPPHESLLGRRPWDEFQNLTVFWTREYFEHALGVGHMIADEAAHRVASTIVNDLDRLALGAFRRPPARSPDGLYVPVDLVADAMAAAPVR